MRINFNSQAGRGGGIAFRHRGISISRLRLRTVGSKTKREWRLLCKVVLLFYSARAPEQGFSCFLAVCSFMSASTPCAPSYVTDVRDVSLHIHSVFDVASASISMALSPSFLSFEIEFCIKNFVANFSPCACMHLYLIHCHGRNMHVANMVLLVRLNSINEQHVRVFLVTHGLAKCDRAASGS